MPFDFSTTQNKNYLQTINQNAPDAGAALKVLSLNLPSFLGGSPIAPDALLRPGLNTSAQVGGTIPQRSPVAAPSSALMGLLAQLGAPREAESRASIGQPTAQPSPASFSGGPSLPSQVSTQSAAPITALASNALGGGAPPPAANPVSSDQPDTGANNFAPPTAPPRTGFTFAGPPRTTADDPLSSLIAALLQQNGSGDMGPSPNADRGKV